MRGTGRAPQGRLRSYGVTLGLVGLMAASLVGCGNDDRRCVDANDVVVDDHYCEDDDDGWGYHYYYGGRGHRVGQKVSGGSTSPKGGILRGGFGSGKSGGSAGG